MGLFSNAKQKQDEKLAQHQVTDEMLKTFIGPNADYYIGARDKDTILGWHWPIFLFIIPWLAYRKLYWFVLLVLFVQFIMPLFGWNLSFTIQLAIFFYAATTARYYYYVYAVQTIAKINKKTQDSLERDRLYRRKGGVSIAASIIFGIVIVLGTAWHIYAVSTGIIPNPVAQAMNTSSS